MVDKPLLSGKTILVTGAASGIGAAAARTFSQHGAALVLVDINAEDGERVAKDVQAAGGPALFMPADVRSSEAMAQAVATAVDSFGRLDCAFNNAGVDGNLAPLHESTEDNWRHVLGVNLTGVWNCMRAEICQMLTQGGGSIVNTASVAAVVGFPYPVSAYTAAKHGVVGLTRQAALEYAAQSIRVNALCPGLVRTPLLEEAMRAQQIPEEHLAATIPMARLADVQEIAQTAAWLCSDASSYVTGQALAADGGWTAQ
ncbi:SDR family NAD(P)-dependent oxidoreductase [Streptomyces wuyuanensis]|uniref:SDR family NAD(P)-dependent oxidoreductase n=1 Tax=Streptomyces wuyuanensis TaxID=1196353 RepID=UPI0034488A67